MCLTRGRWLKRLSFGQKNSRKFILASCPLPVQPDVTEQVHKKTPQIIANTPLCSSVNTPPLPAELATYDLNSVFVGPPPKVT